MKNKDVNIFFACDDGYIPFLAVSLQSIKENRNKKRKYNITVLHTGIDPLNMERVVSTLSAPGFDISFKDVSASLEKISDRLHTRDYYSKSTYFRLFIPEMFLRLDKAIYFDCDIVVKADVGELFDTEIGDCLVGAVADGFVLNVQRLHGYVTNRIGVKSPSDYFNAGVLLMNLKQMRKFDFERKFLSLLSVVKFEVAQDQDYLNAICRNRRFALDPCWNCMPQFNLGKSEVKLVHYNLDNKPWHKDGVEFSELFWQYSDKTGFKDEIREIKRNYREEDSSEKQTQALIELAESQASNDRENLMIRKRIYRICGDTGAIKQQKIRELERLRRFDVDIENDPPSEELKPEDIEYLKKTAWQKIKTKFAFFLAYRFARGAERKNQLIIDEIRGAENLRCCDGVILTANHFSPFDSFILQRAFDKSKREGKFYRVIREGNYTSFPGFYGFLMRNCDTLPLSSNMATMRKFVRAVDTALKKGDCVLVYPEQSMWHNYRKPKPLKIGAFEMAVKAGVPVVPCFITMRDSEFVGADGEAVQAHTVHIGAPIYPDTSLHKRDRAEKMMRENFEFNKNIYEQFYKMTLSYEG